MFRDSLRMIATNPILGWGYGGFEYNFQHFRINQHPPTAVTEIARHPHNEILLWVVEGGVVALIGIILMLLGSLTIVRQAFRHDRIALAIGQWSAGVPTALCITLLPITLHTQLEYPFYLSALHAGVFLVLLALADRLSVEQYRLLSPTSHRIITTTLLTLALSSIVVMGFAFKGKQAIAQVETFGMEDIQPLKNLSRLSRWTQQERINFDEHLNILLTYNLTGDNALLDKYRYWAQGYLTRRIDKHVYANLIRILQFQANNTLAEHYRRDAVRLFPDDARFKDPIFPDLPTVARLDEGKQ
jgi:O-antigen polymerase